MKRSYKILLALCIVLILGFYSFYITCIHKTDYADFLPIQPLYERFMDNVAEANDQHDMLFAILGTDEREKERSRSDVIMVLKYKAREHKIIAVSVPRDSRIAISGRGINKINAASAFGGSKLQVQVLEDLFHVEGMNYIHINFEGFKKIVDALGGIEVDAPKEFKSPWGEKEVFARKGKNLLMGKDLLQYVRFRHDVDGDFGRIRRQQQVVSSFAASVMKADNLSKLPKIAMLVSQNTDSDMDIFFIMKTISKFKNVQSLDFEFHTLKTTSEKNNGIWYEIIDEDDLRRISDLLQN